MVLLRRRLRAVQQCLHGQLDAAFFVGFHDLDFGALVNLMPGNDGLLHISQISHERIAKVTDVLAEGQVVRVKVLETDEKGRIKLSMKALLDRPEAPPQQHHSDEQPHQE